MLIKHQAYHRVAVDSFATIHRSNSDQVKASILLFLHGKGEAGSSLGALPLVCVHQTAPFQALLGSLPEPLVIAPQAPPIPSIDDWNWREYVKALAEFLADRYANERVVATGFSRGGLGLPGSGCPAMIATEVFPGIDTFQISLAGDGSRFSYRKAAGLRHRKPVCPQTAKA